MREREWNAAVRGESACSRFRRVNVAVTARELVENTGHRHRWPNTLRSGVRQGSALRSDRYAARKGRAALTAASAAGVFLVMRSMSAPLFLKEPEGEGGGQR